MGVDVHLTFTEDGDAAERLLLIAADCAAQGYGWIANMITEGVLMGLSPGALDKISRARGLHVFDRVLPNGWAIAITTADRTGVVHDIYDPSTHWTYPEEYWSRAPEQGGRHVF